MMPRWLDRLVIVLVMIGAIGLGMVVYGVLMTLMDPACA